MKEENEIQKNQEAISEKYTESDESEESINDENEFSESDESEESESDHESQLPEIQLNRRCKFMFNKFDPRFMRNHKHSRQVYIPPPKVKPPNLNIVPGEIIKCEETTITEKSYWAYNFKDQETNSEEPEEENNIFDPEFPDLFSAFKFKKQINSETEEKEEKKKIDIHTESNKDFCKEFFKNQQNEISEKFEKFKLEKQNSERILSDVFLSGKQGETIQKPKLLQKKQQQQQQQQEKKSLYELINLRKSNH